MSDPTTRRRLVPGLIDTEPGLVAHPGPQQYACAPGVYDDLPRLLMLGGYRSIAILHGRRGWEKARRYLPESLGPAEVEEIDFAGDCSPPEIERVAGLLIDSGADAVIGVGGGKVLDTTKAAALRAGAIPAILLPTLASNCSAWANLSVLYELDGTPIGHEIHPVASAAVLVEPRVILDSPPEYLLAGIADTLAKWYECAGRLDDAPPDDASVPIARFAARACRDVLEADGPAALADMRAGRLSDALMRIIQTNIQSAGLVGSFGGAYGRALAAHAVHDGLSVLPQCHATLHGVKVAYGTLVQLVLEGDWESVDRLDRVYSALGLPRRLPDYGIRSAAQRRRIAEVAALPGKTIHDMPFPVDADLVEGAINALESHAPTS